VGAVITVALVDGTLRGFDAATGEPLWSVRLSDVITVSPVRVGDLVVAADTSGYVVAVEDAGALRWARSVDSVESLSALSDGTLLIGQSSGLLTLLGADGDERWTVSVPDARVVDPGVLWGDVIALPTDGGLRGLSVDDGSVLWTLEDLRDARVTEVGLVVDGDHVRRVDSAGRSTLVTTLVEPDGSGPTEAFLVRLGTEWVAVSRLGTITFLGVTDA
jgi:outer membrane protein assembly factor BamB